MKTNKRFYIDIENIRAFAILDTNHRELVFDMNLLDEYNSRGWKVYAINNEGIFFYIANRDLDGYDWCKITKVNQ